jgi:glycosyltransferase involved in cell wall biosynthesis
LSLFHIDTGRDWGGTERQALVLARELRARGFASRLVVQPRSPLHERAAAEGLPVIALRMPGGRSIGAILRLAAAMKSGRCLLVHFHDAPGLAVGSAAASLAKVPLRVLSRQADPGGPRGGKRAKNIDLVIASSEGVKNVLVRGGLPEKSIEVVPAGIDFAPYRDPKERDFLRKEFAFAPDDFLVGVVASLEDPRSYREVIEAAIVIREHAPKARVIILGEGSLRLEPDKKGHDLPANDAVYYLGFRSDIARVLASLDVFVTTSPLIGFGGSLLDAMASGVPVVATEAGGIPDVLVHRETGLLVSPRDHRALAEAVLKLFLDRNLAARLAQRGSEAVREKYSSETMARKIIAVYERLASQKGIRLG